MSLLLKTKAKPHFDRTVTDRSKSLFNLVSTSNLVEFLSLLLASRQLPVASCFSDEYTENHALRVAQPNTNVKRIISAGAKPGRCYMRQSMRLEVLYLVGALAEHVKLVVTQVQASFPDLAVMRKEVGDVGVRIAKIVGIAKIED